MREGSTRERGGGSTAVLENRNRKEGGGAGNGRGEQRQALCQGWRRLRFGGNISSVLTCRTRSSVEVDPRRRGGASPSKSQEPTNTGAAVTADVDESGTTRLQRMSHRLSLLEQHMDLCSRTACHAPVSNSAWLLHQPVLSIARAKYIIFIRIMDTFAVRRLLFICGDYGQHRLALGLTRRRLPKHGTDRVLDDAFAPS
eukprot:XP_008659166.1 uncharacterized protein LOC103637941 [Zea mays]